MMLMYHQLSFLKSNLRIKNLRKQSLKNNNKNNKNKKKNMRRVAKVRIEAG
jgi:hypothetical protein